MLALWGFSCYDVLEDYKVTRLREGKGPLSIHVLEREVCFGCQKQVFMKQKQRN